MTDEDKRKRLIRRIRKLVQREPELVAEILLNTPMWLSTVDPEAVHKRFGDDDNSFLSVGFSSDSDAWPLVYQLDVQMDPESLSSPRYRTYFGGGSSLRTRQALVILAKAIDMDNADRPQSRTKSEPTEGE